MSRVCNCQNRKAQKAYLGKAMELTKRFVITDMDDVDQKKVYKCFVVVLMHNHCHLRGEIHFKLYFNVIY